MIVDKTLEKARQECIDAGIEPEVVYATINCIQGVSNAVAEIGDANLTPAEQEGVAADIEREERQVDGTPPADVEAGTNREGERSSSWTRGHREHRSRRHDHHRRHRHRSRHRHQSRHDRHRSRRSESRHNRDHERRHRHRSRHDRHRSRRSESRHNRDHDRRHRHRSRHDRHRSRRSRDDSRHGSHSSRH